MVTRIGENGRYYETPSTKSARANLTPHNRKKAIQHEIYEYIKNAKSAEELEAIKKKYSNLPHNCEKAYAKKMNSFLPPSQTVPISTNVDKNKKRVKNAPDGPRSHPHIGLPEVKPPVINENVQEIVNSFTVEIDNVETYKHSIFEFDWDSPTPSQPVTNAPEMESGIIQETKPKPQPKPSIPKNKFKLGKGGKWGLAIAGVALAATVIGALTKKKNTSEQTATSVPTQQQRQDFSTDSIINVEDKKASADSVVNAAFAQTETSGNDTVAFAQALNNTVPVVDISLSADSANLTYSQHVKTQAISQVVDTTANDVKPVEAPKVKTESSANDEVVDTSEEAEAKAVASLPLDPETGKYVVIEGDNCWNIAKAQLKKETGNIPTNKEILTRTKYIIDKNLLSVEKDNYTVLIYPKQKLQITI